MCRSFVEGHAKPTNEIRDLQRGYNRDVVPLHWRHEYATPANLTLTAFLSDLSSRLRVLDEYPALLARSGNGNSSNGSLCAKKTYWVGGLFSPESFMTATRQVAAQVTPECLRRYLSLH